MSAAIDNIIAEGDESAVMIQKVIRGRQGRRSEYLLKKRAAVKKAHDQSANVQIHGISRGSHGRNKVSDARSQELAAIRIQALQRGRSGRYCMARKAGDVVLTQSMIKSGLKCHGRHPITLRHAYLQLELAGMGLKSIDTLQSYCHIMYLNLSDNAIESLEVLSKLPTILDLNARRNNLTKCLDFSPPRCSAANAWSMGHTALGSMLVNADLSDNSISRMGDLSHHPFLETLILGKNAISSIEGIQTLKFLQVLDLSNNNLTFIGGLDNLRIRELNLCGNQIQTLHGLESIETLCVLDVSNNKIACLAPLRHCKNLSHLDVRRNDISLIRQVEFLRDLQWLRTLIMMENRASSKPYYRYCVIRTLPSLLCLDRTTVSTEEQVNYMLISVRNH